MSTAVDLMQQPHSPLYGVDSTEAASLVDSPTDGGIPTKTTVRVGSSVPTACPADNSGEEVKLPITSSSGVNLSFLRNWKWEISACILILAVPAIMVATVLPHANQPIPQWPFKITINALLSIYTLFFKSAIAYVVTSCIGQIQWSWFSSNCRPLSDMILFDNAGRGPWGSLTMLWAHRLRQPLTLPAVFILICGLAIDPFIQQIIHPVDCSTILDHHFATLPSTNRLDLYPATEEVGGNSADKLRVVLDVASSSSGREVTWECSTGNCTFNDNYSTLGICSACEDRSSEVVVDSKLLKRESFDECNTQNITTYLSSGDQGLYWSIKDDQLNTTFVDSCNPYERIDVSRMDIWTPSFGSSSTSLRADILVGKTTFSDERRLISTGNPIAGCEAGDTDDTWRCRGYGAASCTLKPCVRTYDARIEAGRLTERLISQSTDIEWGEPWPLYHGVLDTKCLSAQETDRLTAWGYEINDTVRWIPITSPKHLEDKITYDYEGDGSDWSELMALLLDRKCAYIMDTGFLNRVGYGDTMGDIVPIKDAANLIGLVQGVVRNRNEAGEARTDTFAGPQLLQNIYNYGDVDLERIQSIFSNISEALTNFIRTHGNTSHSEPAKGQVQRYATCLGVQWPWISLPAALAALTILFLVLTIESTERLKTPVWKASPLPWILSGNLENENHVVSTTSQGQPTVCLTVARMEEESKQILVTVSEGTAPKLEMVHIRDPNLQVDDVMDESDVNL